MAKPRSARRRAQQSRYDHTPEGRARQVRYNHSTKGKARTHRYQQGTKFVAVWRRYCRKPEVKAHKAWLLRSYRTERRIRENSL